MSQLTPPGRISELLAGYTLGTLDAAEAKEFAQIVEQDSALLDEVERMQQALEMAYDVTEAAPPPMLKERILAVVDSGAVAEKLGEETLAEAGRSPNLKRIVLALAAALGLSVIGNYFLWQQTRTQIATVPAPTELDPAAGQEYTLTSSAPAAEEAQVIVNSQALTAQLSTSQLPTLGPEEVYVLWTVLEPDAPFTTDEKNAILTTTFRVDESGEASETISVPPVFRQPEFIAALGITVESAVAPQQHSGAPILLLPL